MNVLALACILAQFESTVFDFRSQEQLLVGVASVIDTDLEHQQIDIPSRSFVGRFSKARTVSSNGYSVSVVVEAKPKRRVVSVTIAKNIGTKAGVASELRDCLKLLAPESLADYLEWAKSDDSGIPFLGLYGVDENWNAMVTADKKTLTIRFGAQEPLGESKPLLDRKSVSDQRLAAGTSLVLPNLRMRLIPVLPKSAASSASEGTALAPYCIQATEVTRGQWVSVMGTQPWVLQERKANRTPDQPSPLLPANHVPWSDAEKFCLRLTRRQRAQKKIDRLQEFRLPTEAEWEFACRAGSTATTPDALSWQAHVGQQRRWQPYPVAQKKPNGFGTYDMLGNVSEYCIGSAKPPEGMRAWARVARGGTWANGPELRFDTRVRVPKGGWVSMGFRIVLVQSKLGDNRAR